MMRALRPMGLVFVSLFVVGCGVGQAVKDGTVGATKWAFTKQVKTMNIDLVGRSSLNVNGAGQSLSTVVRIYQLKSPQAFQSLEYAQLQTNDLDALKADLLATKDVVLRPDASASISEPMKDEAQYVGVVAFFRDIGGESNWKLVVPKNQWKATNPVKIEVVGNTLFLVDVRAPPSKQLAPQQSVPNPQDAVPPADAKSARPKS